MTVKGKSATSHVVKVTGMSPELLALLDARVKEQHAAGRAIHSRTDPPEQIYADPIPSIAMSAPGAGAGD